MENQSTELLKSNSSLILQGSSNATFIANKCSSKDDIKKKNIKIIIEREIP